MKTFTLISAGILSFTLATSFAATPEQEKQFVDSYKKALEAGDSKTLNSFLYTKGAQQEQIEFFQMMQQIEPGAKITSIELVTPSADEVAKYNKPMPMPDGKNYVLGLKPTKQLVVVSEVKNENGSSKNTNKCPIAEKDGKLVIPVPVPAK